MTQNIFDLLETGSARISTPATVKNTTPAEPETRFKTWKFLGGKVIANTEKERFQVVFTEIPDKEIREELKRSGFHWSPTNNAWQRLLNFNSVVALRRLPYLSKIAGTLAIPEAQKTQETLKEILERVGCQKVNEHNYTLTLDGKPVFAFFHNNGVYTFNACKNGELVKKIMLAIMLEKKGE